MGCILLQREREREREREGERERGEKTTTTTYIDRDVNIRKEQDLLLGEGIKEE